MKILIATDGSGFSEYALREACDFASGRHDISFRVISVYEPHVPMAMEPYALSAEYFDRLDRYARERSEEVAKDATAFVRSHSAGETAAVDSVVELGGPAQRIVDEAEKWGADLIVVGSHGHGFWGRLALGSVSDAVVHHAPCSVLVVKHPRP